MKIEIKKLGSFQTVNADGFVNAVDTNRPIQEKWQAVIDKTTTFYRTQLGENLHSVYIRGSVAKANAIDFGSDLDSFAITHSDVEKDLDDDLFQETMRSEFPFCTGIEISTNSIADLSRIPPKRTRSIMQELIKVHSRCVFGEDLSPTIEKFRIEEMLGHGLYLTDEVKTLLPKIIDEDKDNAEELKSICTWIMKRVVRASFDLVMIKEQKYTRDLYLCYEQSSKHFPEREESLRMALDFCLNPSESLDDWMPLVADLSAWIEEEMLSVLT